MPKVSYSTSKGLIQESGKGCVLPIRRKVITLTNASTTARSMAAHESGTLIQVNPSTATATTVTITLPTAASATAGCFYEVVLLADAGHSGADVKVTTGAAGTDIFGYMVRGGANSTVLDFDGISSITMDASVSTDFNQTRMTFLCDGSHWHLSGYSKVAIATALAVEAAGA